MARNEPARKPPFPTVQDELRKTSNEVADAFYELRKVIAASGPITPKFRELMLVAAFTATRNEGGFRIHCWRARDEGATREEVDQAILLTLGASQGLSPVVEALNWAREIQDAHFPD